MMLLHIGVDPEFLAQDLDDEQPWNSVLAAVQFRVTVNRPPRQQDETQRLRDALRRHCLMQGVHLGAGFKIASMRHDEQGCGRGCLPQPFFYVTDVKGGPVAAPATSTED